MDAIKKKMQAMKLEKDNAMDKADTCEQQARDANLRAEKVPFFYLFILFAINTTAERLKDSLLFLLFIGIILVWESWPR